jgi:dihydroflavonol-4-reductase
MKALVTGGTGFVGSHTVAELVRGGHQVRLLVRSPRRVGPALGPLGVTRVETAVGDVTDPGSVEAALRGCDAVVHAASVYSFDPRMDRAIRKTNVRGTEVVLGLAHRLGLDPIVHVSSYGALIGNRGETLRPDSPPTTPPGAYLRSKADSDRVARQFQQTGAPVVIVYPGGVWGPHDPHYGESCQVAEGLLRGTWTFLPPGAFPMTDVRDLAKLHAAVLERGRGPRRYMATARNVTLREVLDSVARLTGRRLPVVAVPLRGVLMPARLLDALQTILPVRLPFNFQAIYIVGLQHRVDDSATRRDFGLAARPLDETVGDQLRWMVGSGRLSPKAAGRLAADAAAAG